MKSLGARLGWLALLLLSAGLFAWYLQANALEPGASPAATQTPADAGTQAAPATETETATETGSAPDPDPARHDVWEVVHVFDGDTFEVERGGVIETVRMIGIDTPERGRCGADEARNELASLLGQDVILVPGAETDRDPYDRLLRYVEWPSAGDDFNLHMIEDGYAIARFDWRSNQPHDREDEYIALSDWLEGQRICPESAWDRGY